MYNQVEDTIGYKNVSEPPSRAGPALLPWYRMVDFSTGLARISSAGTDRPELGVHTAV